MKRFLSTLVVAFMATAMMAQMKIWYNGDVVYQRDYTQIDSITFSLTPTDPPEPIDPPTPTEVLDNGVYCIGPATAVEDIENENVNLALMAQGINEYNKYVRAGLYEKYVALEGGKEFEIVYSDGETVTHYGANLELSDPFDVDNGITIQVYKGVMVKNTKITVPVSGFYHIALDLNVNNDIPDPMIIVSPVAWELSDGTMLVASEFNKTSMTWTLAEKEYQSSSKYKYRWGHGWKIKVTPAAEINIETNLGEGMKSGAADIQIKRGVWGFKLTWNLTGGAVEKGFKNEVTLVRALEAADYSNSELVVVGNGVDSDINDYANADGGWSWGHIYSLGTPAKNGDVYTWMADVKLFGGQGFKVRSNKTTDSPYIEIGDGPDLTADFSKGANGTYTITVVIDAASDKKTVTITPRDVVIPDYSESVVGVLGTAVARQNGAVANTDWNFGNFFSLGTPTKNGNVYTWSGIVELQAGLFKFRSESLQDNPYIERGDPVNGTYEITEAGTYSVTLTISAETGQESVGFQRIKSE